MPGPRRFATRAAHAGTSSGADADRLGAPLSAAGERPHALPVHLTSNFSYPDAAAADQAAQGGAYLYSRVGNPTVQAFEAAMADLEGGAQAVAFGSGMAAVAAAMLASAPDSGGELLLSDGIYGGSTELATTLGPRLGLVPRSVAAWDTEAVRAAISPRTRAVLVETVSNPLLRVADLKALGALAQERGFALIVDATFTSPALCRPLDHGATVVVHSVSKFIGGHGDLVGGVAVGGPGIMAAVHRHRTMLGAVMDPLSAFLALRGLRTLPLRMERQCHTATRLAQVLAGSPRVRETHHPALAQHPDRERAAELLAMPGAMIAFELADGTAARRFYDRVRVIARAASLGEVSSLLTHPASFSHRTLSPEERRRQGVTEGLLRLSVGIEDPEDLIDDVLQALDDQEAR